MARALLHRDRRVIIAARDADELAQAAELLRAGRPGDSAPRDAADIQTRVCDVRDREAVHALVEEIERDLGPIETAITVAGIIQAGPAESMQYSHFEDAINTMTWGPIHVAMAVLPGMRARRAGHIGTVASLGGMVAAPHLLPYSTAKFGAVGFSDGLASELSGTGVTATTIAPGLMRTGGHEHALFTGKPEQEYAWFAPSASLPLVSIDADRAAARYVDAVLDGRPMVTSTPLAWIGIRARGLAPGLTTRVMGLANRALPDAPEGEAPTIPGRQAAQRLSGVAKKVVDGLSVLGTRAARRNNERAQDLPGGPATESAQDPAPGRNRQ